MERTTTPETKMDRAIIGMAKKHGWKLLVSTFMLGMHYAMLVQLVSKTDDLVCDMRMVKTALISKGIITDYGVTENCEDDDSDSGDDDSRSVPCARDFFVQSKPREWD